MLIQVGLDALFQILEGFIHAGVAGFSFVDGSALVVGADEGGDDFVVADFDAALYVGEAADDGVFLFKGFRFWHGFSCCLKSVKPFEKCRLG